MVGRLKSLWHFLVEDEAAADDLAREYITQFDGYDPIRVQEATTRAIAKATNRAPTPGEIKAELRTPASEDAPRYRYLPPHGRGPSPEYAAWIKRDRALTREAFAKAKSLPEDDVCFGKRTRAVVAGLED